MGVKDGVEQGDPNPTHPQVGAGKPPPKYQRIPDGALTAYGGGTMPASLAVNDIPAYVNITSAAAAGLSFTITLRANAATTVTCYIQAQSTMAFPTGAVALIAGLGGSAYYFYSEAPVVCGSNDYNYSGVTPQAFTGGTAPSSGIWHFLAEPTTASTNISLNIAGAGATPLQAVNSVLSLILNTTFYLYEVPVLSGTSYAITGGTVQTGGWIGPA